MKDIEANTYLFTAGPTAVVHRNESVLKNIFKRGYEEIRNRKLLVIWKKDRTWLKYFYFITSN
jgi:mevalonate pyrophosphate decarboxylase